MKVNEICIVAGAGAGAGRAEAVHHSTAGLRVCCSPVHRRPSLPCPRPTAPPPNRVPHWDLSVRLDALKSVIASSCLLTYVRRCLSRSLPRGSRLTAGHARHLLRHPLTPAWRLVLCPLNCTATRLPRNRPPPRIPTHPPQAHGLVAHPPGLPCSRRGLPCAAAARPRAAGVHVPAGEECVRYIHGSGSAWRGEAACIASEHSGSSRHMLRPIGNSGGVLALFD